MYVLFAHLISRPPPAPSGRHALQMHLLLTAALSVQPAVQWVLIENTLSSSAVPDLLLRRRGFCLFPWLALIVRWVVSTDVDICAACKIVNGIPRCHHPGWDTERFGALEDLVCSSSIAAPAPRLPLRWPQARLSCTAPSLAFWRHHLNLCS